MNPSTATHDHGHELQDLSLVPLSHTAANETTNNQIQTSKPVDSPLRQRSIEQVSHHEIWSSNGRMVWKNEISWWERNIARVVSVGDDVRDHFGEFLSL